MGNRHIQHQELIRGSPLPELLQSQWLLLAAAEEQPMAEVVAVALVGKIVYQSLLDNHIQW
jgi:hypothetical protein